MLKKSFAIGILSLVFIMGCGNRIAATYNASQQDGIMYTYYKMNDGTWKCGNITYKYRLELTGRIPNAVQDSDYVILTNNDELTFTDVWKSQYSSSLDDTKIMEGSIIVEMR